MGVCAGVHCPHTLTLGTFHDTAGDCPCGKVCGVCSGGDVCFFISTFRTTCLTNEKPTHQGKAKKSAVYAMTYPAAASMIICRLLLRWILSILSTLKAVLARGEKKNSLRLKWVRVRYYIVSKLGIISAICWPVMQCMGTTNE